MKVKTISYDPYTLHNNNLSARVLLLSKARNSPIFMYLIPNNRTGYDL